MAGYVYYRIFGHVLTIYLQISYFLEMYQKLTEYQPKHPKVEQFGALLTRFITVWIVFYQTFYAFLALLCDMTTALNIESAVPKWLRHHRFTLAATLNPIAMGPFINFWCFFFFDRSLILPDFLEVVISPGCNLVMHGWVALYAVWEWIFLPKDPKMNFELVLAFLTAYFLTLHYTRYVDFGYWPYEYMNKMEGSFFIYMIMFCIIIGSFITCKAQEKLRRLVWRGQDELKRD